MTTKQTEARLFCGECAWTGLFTLLEEGPAPCPRCKKTALGLKRTDEELREIGEVFLPRYYAGMNLTRRFVRSMKCAIKQGAGKYCKGPESG